MSTKELDAPARPPKKRRQLEDPNTLDRWLAVWANDESLTPSERRRVQVERERRKRAKPTKALGVLVADGGASPEQVAGLRESVELALPTEVHHVFCAGKVHSTCKATGANVVVLRGESGSCEREIVQAADEVIGIVSSMQMPEAKTGTWASLRYAKDRGLPVKIIWPNGSIHEGDW